MKRLSFILPLVLMIAVQCQKSVPVFDSQPLLDRWVAMWNSYDLSEVDVLFITDDRLTYLSSEKEGVMQGIEAIREHHRGFGFVPNGKEQLNKLWVEDVHVSDLGGSAVIAGVWFFQRGGQDAPPPQRGPFTFVYVLGADGFRIVHANFGNYEDGE